MKRKLIGGGFALFLLAWSVSAVVPTALCAGLEGVTELQAAALGRATALPGAPTLAARGARRSAGSVVHAGSGKDARQAPEGAAAAALDDDIPGVAAPASPITDTLDEFSDIDDVYRLDLEAGQVLSVSLTGPVGTDFDAFLFPPGTISVASEGAVAWASGDVYPDTFAYVVATSGTYYLDVYAYAGSGSYTITYSTALAPPDDEIPGVAAPPSPIIGALDGIDDIDDVYRLNLEAGQVLSVSLTGSESTDFDMYLFPPGSTSVLTDEAVAGAVGDAYPDTFTYVVATSGTYYLDVYAYIGSGSYTLTYSVDTGSTTIPLEHDAAGVVFDRFVTGYSTAYSGGGYVYGRWTGTELKATFTGTSIAWVGPKQPSYGMADVWIDGALAASNVDCYQAAPGTLSATIWESATLLDGPHTLSIRLTGVKNAASSGNVVVIDKFDVTGASPQGGGTRIDDSLAAPGYTGTWLPYVNPTYYNKTYAYSRWAGAAFTASFSGTKVAWIGPRTPNYGIADVYIDSVKVATVDTYRANLAIQGWREVVWQSGVLAPGAHTISIRPTGTKNPAATAANVVIDAIDVTP